MNSLSPLFKLIIILFAVILIDSDTFAQTAADSVGADSELLQRADLSRTYGLDMTLPTVHEFADPACGSCRAFHLTRGDSLKSLLDDQTNFVYRFTPIPRLMRGYHGAKAALCAGGVADKPGFEGMLNTLFENMTSWRVLRDPYPAFEGYAIDLELPIDEFRSCYERDAVAPLIVLDLRLGGVFGARGTPTFVFVPPAEGAMPVDVFYGNESMNRFKEALSKLPSSQ
jgi:protein-disulfide isomerase